MAALKYCNCNIVKRELIFSGRGRVAESLGTGNMFKFISRMDKTVKSNCICLFISLVILGMFIASNQNRCSANSAYQYQTSKTGKAEVSKAVRKYYSACVNVPFTGFVPPSEVGVIIGYGQTEPKLTQPVVVETRPLGRYVR